MPIFPIVLILFSTVSFCLLGRLLHNRHSSSVQGGSTRCLPGYYPWPGAAGVVPLTYGIMGPPFHSTQVKKPPKYHNRRTPQQGTFSYSGTVKPTAPPDYQLSTPATAGTQQTVTPPTQTLQPPFYSARDIDTLPQYKL